MTELYDVQYRHTKKASIKHETSVPWGRVLELLDQWKNSENRAHFSVEHRSAKFKWPGKNP